MSYESRSRRGMPCAAPNNSIKHKFWVDLHMHRAPTLIFTILCCHYNLVEFNTWECLLVCWVRCDVVFIFILTSQRAFRGHTTRAIRFDNVWAGFELGSAARHLRLSKHSKVQQPVGWRLKAEVKRAKPPRKTAAGTETHRALELLHFSLICCAAEAVHGIGLHFECIRRRK